MASCRAKKPRIEEPKDTLPENESQEKTDDRFLIEPDVMFVEPLQARHPVADWEIYKDEFGEAWKIVRIGGDTEVYRDFEDLVRSCDRADLDTLWNLAQAKYKDEDPKSVKAMELWVHFRRLKIVCTWSKW